MDVISELNYIAIFFAVLIGQSLELLWFSRGLFGYFWAKDIGLGAEGVASRDKKYGFLTGFLLSICTSFLLSILIHAEHGTSAFEGVLLGFLAAAFVAVAQAINFVYETRPIRFYLISVGYCLVAYPLMGLVLGYWM
ncbi:MAG: DUF1761 domain-containing protein [Imperialibacter sp.]|uniref:DUF1761 domain-containing protein n=1 Tax=Imperialibacter sp. TaxID=2038411 RepID=UPI0032ED1EF4